MGYKVFHGSTLVATILPPLIGTVTGAPGPAFPPDGSEGVRGARGCRTLSPDESLSEHLAARVWLRRSL